MTRHFADDIIYLSEDSMKGEHINAISIYYSC